MLNMQRMWVQIKMKRIYMDHAATTPVAKEVVEAMLPYFSEKFGNASSLHSFGREAKDALERSREIIAKSIGAKSDEIIFTSGGTESDNMAIKEVAFMNREKGNHIITSKIEHHAVLHCCEFLEKMGFKITYLPVDEYGLVNPNDVEKAITPKTVLCTIMHANNEIGTIEPISEIGRICAKNKIYFHTDAVQTFGKVPIDVKKMNIDLMSVSSHKLYGPKGVGFLFVKKGTKIGQLIHGGGHEFDLRSGTENVAGIVGFAKATEIAMKNMPKESKNEIMLRDKLIRDVLKIPNTKLNGHPTQRLPNNANFSFSGIEGEALIMHLDMNGIAASTGSACSTKSLEPSHVLTAIGLPAEKAHGSLRLTLGKDNTESDIDYAVSKVKDIVENLRKISPIK